jgi:hypothetical protein
MNKPATLPIGKVSHTMFAWPLSSRSDANTIAGNMVQNRDFIEFVRSLNARDVRYLVVGGYAVALHGYPRYTKDLDVWIEPTESNESMWLLLWTTSDLPRWV